VGFEPTISAGEQPQTHALDRATTGTGFRILYEVNSLLCTPCPCPFVRLSMTSYQWINRLWDFLWKSVLDVFTKRYQA